MLRALARPVPAESVLLLCDIQTRFAPLIHEFKSVVQVAGTLCQTAALLKVPVVATEQYPKALGSTVPELAPYLRSPANPGGAPAFSKMRFSMMTPEVEGHLAAASPGWKDAIIVGLETHVCVQQTAMDLLAAGKGVWVIVDGVSSQRTTDRAVALDLLRDAGARLTTTESLMLALLGDATHPSFKPVQKVLIEHNKVGSQLGPR
jgi:nicotinamidase-related amidase